MAASRAGECKRWYTQSVTIDTSRRTSRIPSCRSAITTSITDRAEPSSWSRWSHTAKFKSTRTLLTWLVNATCQLDSAALPASIGLARAFFWISYLSWRAMAYIFTYTVPGGPQRKCLHWGYLDVVEAADELKRGQLYLLHWYRRQCEYKPRLHERCQSFHPC